jgi:hypothetical protein
MKKDVKKAATGASASAACDVSHSETRHVRQCEGLSSSHKDSGSRSIAEINAEREAVLAKKRRYEKGIVGCKARLSELREEYVAALTERVSEVLEDGEK